MIPRMTLLTGATASDGTNTVKLGYTYDEGDRLKTIAHNGFEYTYEYDFLGNQTRILAGGNALKNTIIFRRTDRSAK